jgi:hypothetical protein
MNEAPADTLADASAGTLPVGNRWWGEYPIAAGARSYWRLGTLECLIERAEVEWTITSSLGVDPLDETVLYEPQTTRTVHGTSARVVCHAATNTLHLEPRLLDRTVVSRPLSTISILPSTTAELYVTTPTRVLLMTGNETLLELPSTTLRSTWIGPNTRIGEVGYATRTTARLNLSYLTVHPTRAVTRVAISNVGKTALKLERVNVPVRQLALYVDATSRLWTSGLRLTVRDGTVEDVQIEPGAPDIAGDSTPFAPALEHLDRSRMRRVFDALFS